MSTPPKSPSVFIPSSSTTPSINLPPPPKKTNAAKIITSSASGSTPQVDLVVTNRDILIMMKQVKSQLEQQDKTNKMLFKEIDGIKSSKKPVEQDTPLIPRVLEYESPDPTQFQKQGSSKTFSSGIEYPKLPDFWNSRSKATSTIPGSYQSAGGYQYQYAGSSIPPYSTPTGLYSSGPSIMSTERPSEFYKGDDMSMEMDPPFGSIYRTKDPNSRIEIPCSKAGNYLNDTPVITNQTLVQYRNPRQYS